MIRAGFVLALSAQVALAGPDDFAPDFDALFKHHATDLAHAQPDVALLELPGPVIVTRDTRGGTKRYAAEDQSGRGALLCAFDRMIQIAALAVKCPDLLDEGEKTRLETRLRRIGRFMADTTFPPVPQADVDRRLRLLLTQAVDAAVCPSRGAGQGDTLILVRSALRADNPAIEVLLGQPRLPVAHPCQ